MTSPEPPTLSPRQSAELLAGLDELKRHGRRGSGAPWLPPLLAGAVTVASAPLVAAFGTDVLGAVWIVGGALAFAALFRYYRRRAERTGISGRGPEMMAGGVATFVVCFAIAAVGGSGGSDAAVLIGPPLLVLASYAAYGRYQRWFLPTLALAPGVLAAVALFALDAPAWSVELAFGLGLLGTGWTVWLGAEGQ